METMIMNETLKRNAEGYLTDFTQWNEAVAEQIAREEGMEELTPKHWAVIAFLQEQHKKNIPLTIRKVGSSGVTDIKEFYALFPNGPLKKASKIAGIPKPVSCI